MCCKEGLYSHDFNSLCLFNYIAFLEVTTNDANYIQFSSMIKKFELTSLLQVTTQPSPDLLLVFYYNVRRSGVH